VPDAPPADTVVTDTTEVPSDQPVPDTPPDAAAAPPESGEVVRTEDNKDQTEVASGAPVTSGRPKSRPEKKPEPAVEQTAAAEPAPDAPADTAAVNDALQEALAGEASETPAAGSGTAASGPPMTSGEKDALVVAVKQCWNVGALSTDALRTVVTVGVSMGPDGKPDGGSIRMLGSEGGDETAAQQAFEAGRRAILRCAGDGYALPPEKYEQWREVEIVFNPDKMRMK
jgi:hypothetical protein